MGEMNLPKKMMDAVVLLIISWRDLVITKSPNGRCYWLNGFTKVTSKGSCFTLYPIPLRSQYEIFVLFFSDRLVSLSWNVIISDFLFWFPHQFSMWLCAVILLCRWVKLLPSHLKRCFRVMSSCIQDLVPKTMLSLPIVSSSYIYPRVSSFQMKTFVSYFFNRCLSGCQWSPIMRLDMREGRQEHISICKTYNSRVLKSNQLEKPMTFT